MLLICIVPSMALMDQYRVVFSIGNASGYPGDTVSLDLQFEIPDISIMYFLSQLTFDESALEFAGFSDYGEVVNESLYGIGGLNDKKGDITLALISPTTLKGHVCSIVFKIKTNATAGEYTVSMAALTKPELYGESVFIKAGKITVAKSPFVPSGHKHELIHTEGKESTCCDFGVIEHWGCSTCHKYFADKDAKIEITETSMDKDPGNHVGGTELRWAREPVNGYLGYTGDVYCAGCGKLFTKGYYYDSDGNEVTVIRTEGNDSLAFKDVFSDDAYYDAVKYVYENGIFKGISNDTFGPKHTMTRAMFVTILGRMEKIDEKQYPSSAFSDVLEDTWYTGFVAWANNSGIVKGYSDEKFGPNDFVTVEQAIAIIARYARYLGLSTDVPADFADNIDCADVSSWAVMDMKWAVAVGIYAGIEGKLQPQKNATRSLIAEMIYCFSKIFIDK